MDFPLFGGLMLPTPELFGVNYIIITEAQTVPTLACRGPLPGCPV